MTALPADSAAFAVGVAGAIPAVSEADVSGSVFGERAGFRHGYADGAGWNGSGGMRTGSMGADRSGGSTRSLTPARRPRRLAAAVAAGVAGLGVVAVVLALMLTHPNGTSNRPGTVTVPVTTKPSSTVKHTAPAGGHETGGPSTTAPTATPTPTPTSTPTTKPTPTPTRTPVNPPPTTPGSGGGGGPGGSAPPSAQSTNGAGNPAGVGAALPGITP